MTPPPFATAWLARRLHPGERDEIIGDLDEQFQARARTSGARAARRWYWRQTAALLWEFSMRRRDEVSTDHERVRGRFAWDLLRADVRYARRSLWRSKSFTVTALLTLTLGIGLSTAVFSLVHGVLIDPLPYPNADRLVRLSEVRPDGMLKEDTGVVSDVGLGAWLSMPTAIAHLSPYSTVPIVVTLPHGSENLNVTDVGRDFFSAVQTIPVTGRLITSADFEAGAPPVAVISDGLASRVFGGAQSAVGQLIGIDYSQFVVVGVLPATFAFPDASVDLWRSAGQFRRFPAPGEVRNMGFRVEVVGLLREGQTIADALVSAANVADVMRATADAAGGAPLEPAFHVRSLLDEMVAPVRSALSILAAGTFIVLAAAAVSLANLLIARNTARQREVAVRLALGAGRWRVGRPVLLELLMLAATGGLGAGLLGWWLLRLLPTLAPADLPRVESIHFDARTLMFAVSAAIVTALVAGWLPVWRLSSVSVQQLGNSGGRVRMGHGTGSGERIRSVLAAAQVSLAVLLLVAAVLIGRSLSALLHVDLGYQPDHLLGFRAAIPLADSRAKGRLTAYYHALLEKLAAEPGVLAVGQASALPMSRVPFRSGVSIVGRPTPPLASQADLVLNLYISAGYLQTVGTRIVSGRDFTAADTAASEPVVLIDDLLARRYFPAGDAIGQQIRKGVRAGTIVGIVGRVRNQSPGEPAVPAIYFPTEQSPEFLSFMATEVVVRASGDPAAMTQVIRRVAHDVDATVPVFHARPLSDDLRVQTAGPRFFTVVLGLFAALALSTATLGIYGVVAFWVERRRVEFGIRRALGASEGHVTSVVIRRALIFGAAGLIAGLGMAAVGSRLLRTRLFGVSAADPLSFSGAAAIVLVLVMAAAWVPVRRALRVDPAQSLRVD